MTTSLEAKKAAKAANVEQELTGAHGLRRVSPW